MKKKILIYGAGAIGRGYVPWVYEPDSFEYYFVDSNEGLIRELSTKRRFISFCTRSNRYEPREVLVSGAYLIGDEAEAVSKADVIVTAVGPRNILSLQRALAGTTVPILCFENDPNSATLLKSITGNPNVYFGVPDVITSNTAPKELLAKDSLAIVTEDGQCFVDVGAEALGGNCKYISTKELSDQWLAKLYIHNTPHCITAYLGARLGKTYIHESMQSSGVEKIVRGAMEEMQQMLLKKYQLNAEFVRWYAEKELARFANPLLFDPIIRVAREPFRKLGHSDRLIGAAQLCLGAGVVPSSVCLGIMAAFFYENATDPDANIQYLVNALAPKDFLKIVIRLRESEALFEKLNDRWDTNLRILKGLSR